MLPPGTSGGGPPQVPDPAELREAVGELRAYLADGIAPLLAAESIVHLLRSSPRLVANEIGAWALLQFRARAGQVSLPDLLYHAVRKVHLLGDLGLVRREVMAQHLTALRQGVLTHCPEGERELLQRSLESIGQGEGASARTVDLFLRSSGAGGVGAGPGGMRDAEVSEEVAQALRRFSVLLTRLETRGPSGGPAPAGSAPGAAGSQELAAQLLAAAAHSARNGAELNRYLDRLRQAGLAEAQAGEAIRTLSRSLPGWELAAAPPEGAYRGASAEAIQRIVTLAETPREGAVRFEAMVRSAIEEFNAGSLGRALHLLDLAERVLGEKGIDLGAANSVRGSAHESLDAERLKAEAVEPARHPLLKRLLDFFPALHPLEMLARLDGEPDRQTRRLLLTLLEVHGSAVRGEIVNRLEQSLVDIGRPDAWHWQRNLLYLLRRIPPGPQGHEEREVDYVSRLSALHQAPVNIREAIANLGQVGNERAEGVLITRLREVEAQLEKPAESPHSQDDLRRFLALITAQLSRLGTRAAVRAVVAHALAPHRHFGDSLERLSELRWLDLSEDAETTATLVAALRKEVPSKILGLVRRPAEERLLPLIDALSSTPTPEVRQLFKELVQRFSGQPSAEAAGHALARWESPPPPAAAPAAAAATLEGDLEIFGLPNLLQSLAESKVSGLLTLRDATGGAEAQMTLLGGRLSACRRGPLKDRTAFYQILESPAAASFQVVKQAPEQIERPKDGPYDVLGLLMEGMRRYDELQRARALVPDDAALKATGQSPTPPPGEQDGAFVQGLWTRVKAGATPQDCEGALPVDAFRVRTTLAHWLEEGALAQAPAAGGPTTRS